MEKIIFEDLPSTKTPLNAENLNKIQNNTEKAINELKNDCGKYIYLTKNNIQSIPAKTQKLVTWETIAHNDTNGLLQFENNEVILTEGIHTVLIVARIQNVIATDKYLYIRKWVNNEKQELATTNTTGNALAITTVTQLNAGDSITIEAYSEIDSAVRISTAWTEFKVVLLN